MIEEFLDGINTIISKSNSNNLKRYIYLDNNSSLDLYINKEIKSSNINIIHKLSYFDFNKLIDELTCKYKIYGFIGDRQSLHAGKKFNFKVNIEDKIYDINFIFNDLKSDSFKLTNIYWDLSLKNFIIKNNNLYEKINIDYDEYFNLLSEEMISNILDDFIKLILISRLYFKYKLDIFKNIIQIYIEKFDNDKRFKKNVKSDYSNSNDNFSKILQIIWEINQDSNISQWIEFINCNTFINKLINDIDTFNTYGIQIDSFEKYIIILVVNKSKIINNTYIKYIDTFVSKQLNPSKIATKSKSITKNSGFGNLLTDFASSMINPLENFVNQFDIFFMDKLEDYKKIKNINISNKIDKYCVVKTSNLIFIRASIHILYVMFHIDNTKNYNIEYLKLGYIFKRYHYLNLNIITEIFDIFDIIFKNLGFESYINLEYYFSMYKNHTLKNFESVKSLEIPNIKKNYESRIDTIDIIEFQDTFGLFYEFVIKNSVDTSNYTIDDFDRIFEAELENIRSNKLMENNNYNLGDDIDFVYQDEDEENNENNENINNSSDISFFDDKILEEDEMIEGDVIINEDTEEQYTQDDDIDYEEENKQVNDLVYTLKYKKYKILYGKLKQIDKIIDNKDFDKSIFKDKDNSVLTAELVDIILESNKNLL